MTSPPVLCPCFQRVCFIPSLTVLVSTLQTGYTGETLSEQDGFPWPGEGAAGWGRDRPGTGHQRPEVWPGFQQGPVGSSLPRCWASSSLPQPAVYTSPCRSLQMAWKLVCPASPRPLAVPQIASSRAASDHRPRPPGHSRHSAFPDDRTVPLGDAITWKLLFDLQPSS